METIETTTAGSLDAVFAALADPNRRAILARLAVGEATVGDVAAPLGIALPSVSKHVRVLERSGLVVRRVDGRQHWLRLSESGWRRASDYVDGYRWFWESSLDRLSDMVRGMAVDPREKQQ
jgi:DNA-binding transcriptional ArsR family regulator